MTNHEKLDGYLMGLNEGARIAASKSASREKSEVVAAIRKKITTIEMSRENLMEIGIFNNGEKYEI